MLKLSTKGRYGVRAMIELALGYGGKPLLLKDIADKQKISEGYLEHILPLIKRAGLVNAVRGVNGGYFLAKAPKDIKLSEILEAAEGRLSIVDCVAMADVCERNRECVVRELWQEINDQISAIFSSVTLQDIVDKELKKNRTPLVYHI